VTPAFRGRILAIDYGTVRLGLAVCDPDHIVCSALPIVDRKNLALDAEQLLKTIREEKPVRIVVGLPLHLNGNEGQKAREACAFADWLRTLTPLPVVLFDERFSTAEAEEQMANRGLTAKKRKDRRDSLAAKVILESYMESGCPDAPTFGAIDS
jgi:putative holliday junction resolvase